MYIYMYVCIYIYLFIIDYVHEATTFIWHVSSSSSYGMYPPPHKLREGLGSTKPPTYSLILLTLLITLLTYINLINLQYA